MWSAWQTDLNIPFNSYFIEHPEGNCVVDPVATDERNFHEMDERGGVQWVVLTNRDHVRAAQSFVDHFGAKLALSRHETDPGLTVDRRLGDGETFLGWFVISLDGHRSPGEIALFSRARKAVILGDALWGDPAGSARFMADTRLSDPVRAVLAMRRVRGLPELDRALMTVGASILSGARQTIANTIDARGLASALRINIDDVPMRVAVGPGNYQSEVGEIGQLLGAEKLGYQVVRLEDGMSFCPMHWHTAEEELFIVLDGHPTLLTPHGKASLSPGDVLGFPVGERGAHKLRNDSELSCTVVMVSNLCKDDVCFYPNSQKLMLESTGAILADGPELDYYDGE